MKKLLEADIQPKLIDSVMNEAKTADRVEAECLADIALEAPAVDIAAVAKAINKVLAQLNMPEIPPIEGATKLSAEQQKALNMIDAIYREWHDDENGLSVDQIDKILGVDLLLAEMGTLSGKEFRHWLSSRAPTAPDPSVPMAENLPPEPEPEPEPDFDNELMRRM